MKAFYRKMGMTLILILTLRSTMTVYAQTYLDLPIPKEYKYKVVYADTTVYHNPVLVNIDGIGFLNSKENFDMEHPKSITKHFETSLVICDFEDKTLYPFYDNLLMGMNPRLTDKLDNEGFFNTINPDFQYVGRKDRCEIFVSKTSDIQALIFVAQMDYIIAYLNPKYELKIKEKIKKNILSHNILFYSISV